MRVLHVIPTLDPRQGGPDHAVIELGAIAAESGHHVEIVHTGDKSARSAIGDLQIRCFARTAPARYAASAGLTRYIRENVGHFDVVHIHSIYSVCSLVAGRECRRTGTRYISRPHGSLDWVDIRRSKPAMKLLLAPLVRRHLAGAAAVHCTSAREARELVTFGAFANAVVVPLPVRPRATSTAAPRATRERFGIPLDVFAVLFLGRLHQKKNVEVLIEAVRLLRRHAIDVHLIITGSGKPGYEKSVRVMAESLAVDGAVTFTGFARGTDKYDLLAAAELFVLPSKYENFGVAVVEALQARLPTIVSPGVDIAEFMDGKGGVVVPPTPLEVADAIATIQREWRSCREAYDDRRVAAGAIGWGVFHPEAAGRDLLNLYDRVINKST